MPVGCFFTFVGIVKKKIFFRPAGSGSPQSGIVVRNGPLGGIVLAMLALAVFGCTAASWFVYRLSLNLPTVSQIQNIEQPLASKVLDKDGKLLYEFSIERRSWVPIEKFPVNLQAGIVAIEDRKFYSHGGIDLRRIIGAALVDIVRRGYAQGASTITQQLARGLYLTAKPSMVRKIREALTALQLESCYTKREILELYLNQVYLGGGAWGVEAASEQYFSKHVWNLDLNECATLAGIIQLPERYRPDKKENLNRARVRRNTVLRAMEEVKVIDKAACAAATVAPVPTHPLENKGEVGPYFLEMVRRYVADRYGDNELYNGGLTIYTTLDRAGQEAAETASAKEVASLQHRLKRIFLDSTRAYRRFKIPRDTFLAHFDSLYALNADEYVRLPDSTKLRQAQISVVALDAASGAIRTLIGGRNFEESKFNRVTMALRQPGSSFKPIVYTAAMEHGFTPASVILDQPITLQTPTGEWRPENYDFKFGGPTTIRRAVGLSINLVAIQVLMKVGPEVVVDYARRMGFRHAIQPIPSLAVGSCEATPMEMACAYQIFANKGVAETPYYIEKIVDKSGRVLDRHAPEEREALSPQTAYLMCSLLQTVVCCGTASTIPGLGFTRPAGGKTGTTNDYSDAWFIGFTPQVVCCVWTGVDERRSLGNGVTGSLVAVPVWVPIMIALHRNLPVRDFEVPKEGIKHEKICDESHLIATRFCPKVREECFLAESVVDTCAIHGPGRVAKTVRKDVFGSSSKPPKNHEKKKKNLMY
jgi:penicillin-binding protein 1A